MLGDRVDFRENEFIPRIFSCYLTTFNVNYNQGGAGSFYEDGAPIDVDISMTFQESRALTRKDIEKLQDFAENISIDALGNGTFNKD
jgi:hypothetical protein